MKSAALLLCLAVAGVASQAGPDNQTAAANQSRTIAVPLANGTTSDPAQPVRQQLAVDKSHPVEMLPLLVLIIIPGLAVGQALYDRRQLRKKMMKDGRLPAPAAKTAANTEDLEAATKAPKAKEALAAPSVTASVDTAESSPRPRPGLRPDAAGARDPSSTPPPPSRVSSTSSWDTTQKQ